MTHKLIALRFWVRVWCLSCLCGCSSLDVDDPLRSLVTQQWYQSPVRRRVRPRQPVRLQRSQPATAIQASKILQGGHDELMDSLEGECCCVQG
ncbi:hypothetical protein MTR_8g097100 [Medicago truncatula]|uniref:Transmembrane protein n=1 Tax=Medicago truncatula TaxID=3880 RepID=G7LHA4_MEDTR|nr:hypothetical protein MTR_8g097100 [Medicago truncatula]